MGEAQKAELSGSTADRRPDHSAAGHNPATVDGSAVSAGKSGGAADIGPAQKEHCQFRDSSTKWPIGRTDKPRHQPSPRRNAEQDKLPTIAFAFPLNEWQKKDVVQSVAQSPKSPDAGKGRQGRRAQLSCRLD
jgi:hypothetical protein